MQFYVMKHQGADLIFFAQEDGRRSFVPDDPANTDYQAFLEWVAAGGVPEVIEA